MIYKFLKLIILIGTVYFAVSGLSYAKIFTNSRAGTCGAAFLKIPVGVRAIGMGEAYCGLADEVSALWWNAAGLAQIKQDEAGFMHAFWLDDISCDFIAYAHPLRRNPKVRGETVGVGINYLYLPDTEIFENGYQTGEIKPYNGALSFSYARFISLLMTGVNVKVIQEKIGLERANAYALDLGALYKSLNNKFSLGVSVQNLGSRIEFIEKSFSLPLNIRMGGVYRWLRRSNSSAADSMLAGADLNFPIDNNPNIHLGYEYCLRRIKAVELAGRIGYRTETVSALGIWAGVSCGFGIKLKDVIFDYAFVPYGHLGDTHRLSLTFKIGKISLPEEKIEKYYNRGKIYYEEGNLVKAQEEFRQVLALNPYHTEAERFFDIIGEKISESKSSMRLFTQGYAYYAEENYAEAIASFKKLLSLEPEHDEANKYLFLAEERLKKIREKQTMEKNEKMIGSLYSQAYADYRERRLEKAISSLNKILEIEPGNVKAKALLEKCKAQIVERNYTEGLKFYTEGLKFYEKGELEEAVNKFKKALEYESTHIQAKKYLEKANTQLAENRQQKAKQLYEQGLREYVKENLKEAIGIWEEAFHLDPQNEKIKQALERANKELEKKRK